MIQDPKLTENLIYIIDQAREAGLLTEVIVTAMEDALKQGYDGSKESIDQRIVNLFKSAGIEWDIFDCGISNSCG